MSAGAAQGVLGVVAALGVVLALAPVPRVAGRARAAGVAVMIAAWAGTMLTLLPEGARTRLERPAWAAAAVAGALVAVAAGLVVGRVAWAHPTAWFLALGLTLPVRIPVPLGGDTRNLLLPLYVVIAVGLLGWADAARRGAARDPRSPLDLPLAAMVGFSLASLAWSVDREEGAVKVVFFYIPFALLYLVVAAWWPRARAARTLALATIGLAIPVALLAVWQFQSHELLLNDRLQKANAYSSFFRANSIFFDPNILGRFLVVAMLAVVAIAWIRRGSPRTLAACGLVLLPLCAGLAVSFSRSSCLMLIVGLVLMAAWAFGTRRTAAATLALALLLGGAAFAASGNVRRALTDTKRMNKVSEGRFDLMRGGVDIWREAPVAGSGLGGFETQYEKTLTQKERGRIRVVISHNAPITVLSELGAIGAALLAWLVVATAFVVHRRARGVGGIPGWVAWTMLATMAGILVHTLLYSALFEDPYNWVLLAGAIAVTGAGARELATRDGDGIAAAEG
ncbi:MAG: O-antigen ligase family protein [Thermoleophilia bacterium]|nr:O-antigen ligase family protein [Thermoleophilia bacterium]